MDFSVMLWGAEKLVPVEYWYPYGTVYIEWMGNEIKRKFNFFVFVLSKILVENKQYTLQE